MNQYVKQYGILGIIIGISIFTLSLLGHFVFDDKPDNPAEQIEESIIKSTTGIDIDLSVNKKEAQ
jgi:hypothetical protein